MNKSTLQKLSKEVSYALRHAPGQYGLELDSEGWVDVELLLEALHKNEFWKSISMKDLEEMIRASDKKRHEICNGRIRAFYGHSTPEKIQKKLMEPPEILYHGTARRSISSILKQGLLPQGRQYVHLSEDMEMAECVGKRYDHEPCILEVAAGKAWRNGVAFYYGNESVWLADWIAAEYLKCCDS